MTLRDVTNENRETLVRNIRKLLQTGAAMYMYVTEDAIARFGFEGERAVRKHLRAYGQWRGKEMRMAHQALGLPIQMESLLKNWDSASTLYGEIEEEGTFTPNKVVHDVTACPAAEVWKANEFWRWGHMYCDEFHQACVSSYHPDGYVVIPENLMKGDSACKFSWIMPPQVKEIDFGPVTELGEKLAENYKINSPHEAAVKALQRTTRLLAGRFLTLAQQLDTAFGDQGKKVLSNGLRRWGHYRGQLLRQEHESLSWRIDPSTLFNNFDVPYHFLWHAKEESEKQIYKLEIEHCPLAEVWEEFNAKDLGYIYCRETYPAIIESYGLKSQFSLTKCICDGDEKCMLELTSE